MTYTLPFNTAIIIPTGVGASIGGYAGDAMTLLKLFSEISDCVITHPNVANAASFQALPNNALYVEGYALDQFFRGNWGLSPVRQNRIGVVFDAGMSDEMQVLHRNVIAAVETTYGINITSIEVTEKPLDIALEITDSGRSAGVVNNLEVLYAACDKLISHGANALALCCKLPLPEDHEDDDTYKDGVGIDPIAGIEAMISHAVVARYNLPAAHAPVFDWDEAEPVRDKILDPKIAAEYITPSFLPCVLQGLSKAPQYLEVKPSVGHLERSERSQPTDLCEISRFARNDIGKGIAIKDLTVLITPSDCLGNVPVLSCLQNNIPVIAVENNTTVMQCDKTTLESLYHLSRKAEEVEAVDEAPAKSYSFGWGKNKIIKIANYHEALGVCVELKSGVKLPAHMT